MSEDIGDVGDADGGLSVASFYRFRPIDDVGALCEAAEEACAAHSLVGTVQIAPEGVNATLAGRRADLECVIERLFTGIEVKWSSAAPGNPVFRRLKVRERREIVTFDHPLGSSTPVGKRVSAATWNEMVADPEVLVLDVRNDYESDVGTFQGATRAATGNFRGFPAFVAHELGSDRRRPIAMFCTGGIRCEKASAYLFEQGFENVSQLDGGILKYFAETEPADSLFEGECFVFDERVSVTDALDEGSFELCGTCSRPLSARARESLRCERGAGCPARRGQAAL